MTFLDDDVLSVHVDSCDDELLLRTGEGSFGAVVLDDDVLQHRLPVHVDSCDEELLVRTGEGIFGIVVHLSDGMSELDALLMHIGEGSF